MEIKGRRSQREREGAERDQERLGEVKQKRRGGGGGQRGRGPGADKEKGRAAGWPGRDSGWPGGGAKDGDRAEAGAGESISPSIPRCGPRPAPLAPGSGLAGPQGRGAAGRGWRAGAPAGPGRRRARRAGQGEGAPGEVPASGPGGRGAAMRGRARGPRAGRGLGRPLSHFSTAAPSARPPGGEQSLGRDGRGAAATCGPSAPVHAPWPQGEGPAQAGRRQSSIGR